MMSNLRPFVIAILAIAVPFVLAWVAGVYPHSKTATEIAETASTSGAEVIATRCASCHEPLESGGFNRISNIRKTPEGWNMTLTRMTLWHRVHFSDDERQTMVKYLADRQGLAPSEAAPWRYALEQDYNRVEEPQDKKVNVMCARCHTYARIALQRRDEDEWRKLANTHMGQYPTMEFQEKARSVEHYWDILRDKIPIRLDVLYPFQTKAWTAWKAHPKADLSGTWRIVGERFGQGRYTGIATITAKGNDHYAVTYRLTYADGTLVAGTGTSIVYTGYEWRGSATLGNERINEVFALSEDGNILTGRWFLTNADERGARMRAVRERPGTSAPGTSAIVAVEPPFVRAGTDASLTLYGFGLDGVPDLGPGIDVIETLAQTPEAVTVRVRTDNATKPGRRTVIVGTAHADGLFAVYRQIDTVRVEPADAVARLGGGGGKTRKVGAQFTAIGYLNGPDGKPGTQDDVRLGSFPARWSIAPFNEAAAADHDAEFAGKITDDGFFVPADPGPNEARAKYNRTTNNVGNLKIVAQVDDDAQSVTGNAHLIVAVQRWVRPPIR